MQSLDEMVKQVNTELNMGPVEHAIRETMRKGYKGITFSLIEEPGQQSDSEIHRLGVEKLRTAGFTIEQQGLNVIRVSGWIKA